jgi:hypothetical protein
LLCLLLHAFHPFEDLLVVVSLVADAHCLLVAVVLEKDLPVLPLFK